MLGCLGRQSCRAFLKHQPRAVASTGHVSNTPVTCHSTARRTPPPLFFRFFHFLSFPGDRHFWQRTHAQPGKVACLLLLRTDILFLFLPCRPAAKQQVMIWAPLRKQGVLFTEKSSQDLCGISAGPALEISAAASTQFA